METLNQNIESTEYHNKLKTLGKRGCMIFAPRYQKGKDMASAYWEIGIRDQNGEYCRVAFAEKLRDAIDEAYERTGQNAGRWTRFANAFRMNDDGRAILLIIIMGGISIGLTILLLTAFSRL